MNRNATHSVKLEVMKIISVRTVGANNLHSNAFHCLPWRNKLLPSQGQAHMDTFLSYPGGICLLPPPKNASQRHLCFQTQSWGLQGTPPSIARLPEEPSPLHTLNCTLSILTESTIHGLLNVRVTYQLKQHQHSKEITFMFAYFKTIFKVD